MAITSTCGSHCGIRPNAEGTFTNEGHCGCGECDCPQARAPGAPARPRGVPMCDRRRDWMSPDSTATPPWPP